MNNEQQITILKDQIAELQRRGITRTVVGYFEIEGASGRIVNNLAG